MRFPGEASRIAILVEQELIKLDGAKPESPQQDIALSCSG